MTFPAHTTHLLQPLDVGIYKSLKSNWSQSLNDYMKLDPTEKTNRTNFHFLLNPSFIKTFCDKNINNSFKKCGFYPLNKAVLTEESIAPSKLMTKYANTNSEVSSSPCVKQILSLPTSSLNPEKPKRKGRDSSAVSYSDS